MGDDVDKKTLEAVQEVSKKDKQSIIKSNIMHFLIPFQFLNEYVLFQLRFEEYHEKIIECV